MSQNSGYVTISDYVQKREILMIELKHTGYILHLDHKEATGYWDQSLNSGDVKAGLGTSLTDSG